MTTQGPMLRAVAAAMRDAGLKPEDAGAKALARRYAALIDDATPLAKYDAPLRELRLAVSECSDPEEAGKQLAKIEAALSAHSVASDLGPKLLAALTALGMTAAGRDTKGGAGVRPAAAKTKLDELRQRRDRRRNRTG